MKDREFLTKPTPFLLRIYRLIDLLDATKNEYEKGVLEAHQTLDSQKFLTLQKEFNTKVNKVIKDYQDGQ